MGQTFTAPTLNLTKLNVGTGFEQQQAMAAAKQKLAEAMLQKGLESEQMVSPLQVLGHLAQSYAGKNLQNQAIGDQAKVAQSLREARQQLGNEVFTKVRAGATPEQIFQEYGANPLVADLIKPQADAYAEGLKGDQGITELNGRFVRKGQAVGQINNDPNHPVLQGQNGELSLNWPYVTSQVAAHGNPLQGLAADGKTVVPYPTTGQMPSMQRLGAAMQNVQNPQTPQQQQPVPQPQAPTADGQKYVQVHTPEQYQMLAPGMTYLDPNGQIRVKGK